MNRHLPAVALLVALGTSLAAVARSAEIVVTKPSVTTPATALEDPELQKQYDAMWEAFESAVASTTNHVVTVLGGLTSDAQKSGNLALALHWNEQLESFRKTGAVKWDAGGDNKKTWKDRFDDAPFPDDLATSLTAFKKGYGDAIAELSSSYAELIRKITMAGDLAKAQNLQAEGQAMLAGHAVQQGFGVEKPKAKPNRDRVREVLCGSKWLHADQHKYSFRPDGTFILEGTPRRGSYEILEGHDIVLLIWSHESNAEALVMAGTPDTWRMANQSFRPTKDTRQREVAGVTVLKFNPNTPLTTLFEKSKGITLGASGLLCDLPGSPSWIQSKETYGFPIRVEVQVAALPDRAYDIFPSIFTTKEDPVPSGIHFAWGHGANRGTTLNVFGKRIDLPHKRIVANQTYTVAIEVDKNRRLAVSRDGEQLWAGQLPENANLKGHITLSGGLGRVLYKQLMVSGATTVPGEPRAKGTTPPQEAKVFGGHRYMFVPGKVSWGEAKQKCEEMGGHLVTIGSQEESAFIFQLSQGKPYWIGLFYDTIEGNRAWVTGEPLRFQKWRAGQPEKTDVYGGAGLKGTDEWDDFNHDRSESQNFVCEWE